MTSESTPNADREPAPLPPVVDLDARDRFVDAVISIALTTTEVSRRARIDSLLHAATEATKHGDVGRRSFLFARWRWAGIAAAAALIVALVLWPSASGSSDLLASAARIETQASDRSFDFRIDPPPFAREAPPLFGRLDVRDSEHMLLLLDYPDGTRIVKGRDGARSWMRDRNGMFDEGGAVTWPGWVAQEDGGLVVDSIATLIASIDDHYEIEVPQATTLPDGEPATKIAARLRVSADVDGNRTARRGVEPIEILLWLSPSSRRVLRAEVKWDPPMPRFHDMPPGEPPARRGDPPPHDGPQSGGPPFQPPHPGSRSAGGPELSSQPPGRLTISLKSVNPFRDRHFSPENFSLSK